MQITGIALFFVAGAVSYLVMHELLVAVRDRQQTSALAGTFCLGFLAVIVIDVTVQWAGAIFVVSDFTKRNGESAR